MTDHRLCPLVFRGGALCLAALVFAACGPRPVEAREPSVALVTFDRIEGVWPAAPDERLAVVPLPQRLAGSGWSVPLDREARIRPDPSDDLRPSPRALLLERGAEPIAIQVPCPEPLGSDARVRVRIGSYGSPRVRIGLGAEPAGWSDAAALTEATRDTQLEFAIAPLFESACSSLTVEVAGLEVPALLYNVEVQQGERVTTLHPPEDWPSAGWGTTSPGRVRSLAAPPIDPIEAERALVLNAVGGHSVLRVPLDAQTPTFDFVRMRFTTSGFLRVRACVELAEGPDVLGEYVERESLPLDGVLDLDVTGLAAAARTQELRALRFEFQELRSNSRLFGLELWRRSSLQRLPRADGPPVHVVIGNDSRPARGLAPGITLAGQVPNVTTGRLRWDVALAEGLTTESAHSVTVEVRAGGEVLERRTTPLTTHWTSAQLDLGALRQRAQRPLQVSFSTDHPDGALLTNVAVSSVRAEPPRTVLLITSDTHRADHMGYAGMGGAVKTPFLDELARGGLRFDDATSVTTLTNPSHATMFTGLHLRDTGILGNLAPLAERATTLAECFESAGYRTFAAVSARHLLPWRSGFGQGFERFDGPRQELLRDGKETIAAARAMLADATDEDVFLWLHLFEAHAPYYHHEGITEQYYTGDPYAERLAELAPEAVAVWDRRIRDARYILALYKGEVSYLDQLLAGLFRDEPRLAAAELAFTADHGEALGEQRHYWRHSVLLPATLRVPLILRGSKLGAPLVLDGPVSNGNIGRTLLEMAGLESDDFPGRSLAVPAHRAHMANEPRYVIGSHGLSAGVLHRQWYLTLFLRANIFGTEPGNVRHGVQLFDRFADPACEHDLAAEHPEEVRRLRRALVRWLGEVPPGGPLTGPAPTNSTARADIVALGYAADEASAAQAALIDPGCVCPECGRWR